MRLELVTTSVNYSDFLEHSLVEDLNHFDHIVVVTTPSDRATKALCNKLGVDFIETEAFYERGASFNKARGIRLGAAHLPQEPGSWIVHKDADTVLPHRFRNMLEYQSRLDPTFIYGADRINVFGYEAWIKNKERILSPQFLYRCLVNAPMRGTGLGARLVHQELGYCPIGFFQLWHSSAKKIYPINHGSAEHSDVLFAAQWPREKRALLPEVFVVHLDSESPNGPMGMNWKGRKSRPFGPESKIEVLDFAGEEKETRHRPYRPCPPLPWWWPWWWTSGKPETFTEHPPKGLTQPKK